ncbi:hypothetical protein G3I40_12470 [Streptomyces sp. SID14478]|uniref:hypothetical protein n=1 Tax=Streptomyces sp. SID14478 TaxID=2706073 RepID=UPI0013DC593A|nr:hypothetical protein [Streptomyces sp. SID14478]NEB76030.1 hypothetical protein [Streptomyces sp. SID14478]
MFSDVGPLETVTIAAIGGSLMLGPDRLPEFLQNAGRTVRRLRKFPESAQQEAAPNSARDPRSSMSAACAR